MTPREPEIWLLRAVARNASSGTSVTVNLAGGGKRGYTQFGTRGWKAGLARPPAIIQKLGFSGAAGGDGGGFGDGAIVQALSFEWRGRAKDAAALAALYWRDATFELWTGPDGGADAAMTKILVGRIAECTAEPGGFKLNMVDPALALDVPVLSGTFAGTGDLEGPPELKGQPKWRAWGQVFNVTLRSLDPANNIWVATDPARKLQAIDQVYDRGNAASSLTSVAWEGSEAATLAALRQTSPPQGGAAVAPSIGCIKWWFTNPGRLTADLRGEIGTAYVDRPADIAAALVNIAGGPTVDALMLAAARTARNTESGWLVADESTTIVAEITKLLSGVSLWWGLSSAGIVEIGTWEWGSSVATFSAARIDRTQSFKPVNKVQLGWRRNQTVMARGDIAAAVFWNEVSGSGRPADNATVGATAGADLRASSGAVLADKDVITGAVASGASSLLPNWNLDIADAAGMPAHLGFVEGFDNPGNWGFADNARNSLRIGVAGQSIHIGVGFKAIPIDQKAKLRLRIRHRSSAPNAGGLYVRMATFNAAMPTGKDYIAPVATSSAVAANSYQDIINNGAMPGANWVDIDLDFTPPDGAQRLCVTIYNWGSGVALEIDSVQLVDLVNEPSINALALLNGPAQAGADRTISNTAAGIVNQAATATDSRFSAVTERPPLTGQAVSVDEFTADLTRWTLFGAVTKIPTPMPVSSNTAFRFPPDSQVRGTPVPIDRSAQYIVRCEYDRTGSPNGLFYLGVSLLRADGSIINGDGGFWLYKYADPTSASAAGTPDHVSRYFGAGTSKEIPADAVSMAPIILGNLSGTQGFHIAESARIEKIAPPSEWINDYPDDASVGTGQMLILPGVVRSHGHAGNGWTRAARTKATFGSVKISGKALNQISNTMLSLTDNTGGSYAVARFSLYAIGGSLQAYAYGAHAGNLGDFDLTDTLSIEYDGGFVYHLKTSAAGIVTELKKTWAGAGLTFWGAVYMYEKRDSGFHSLKIEPARSAALIGVNTVNSSGTALSASDLITSQGIAASIVGAGPGATASAPQVMNNRLENGIVRVAQPVGGALQNSASNVAGAIRMKLPSPSGSGADSMIRFRVDIYEYVQDRMQTYEIAGYTHNAASSWISFSARLIGASAAARPVRFGIHGGNWCIWIGDPGGVWQYPGVTVRDVQVHYGNVSAALWEAGWSMAFDTSAATNVTATVSQPVAGDTIFGVNALESVGGAIATRANFRTDQGIAAGFVGAGALATQNVAAWGSQIAGRPAAIVDLDSGTHIFADYIRNAGVQLNNRWPAEFGANVTENRISAGFAGAGALATRNNVDWGAHVINRDAWLTDGRIANGLDDAGRNKMGIRGTGGNVGIPEIVGGIAGTNIAINPEFVGGSGIGWGLYDNSGSGKTSISVLADNSAPNASGYMMRVSYNGSGAPNSGPSPGFGGAVQHIQDAVSVLGSGQARPGFYARNTNVYWRIWAKIPAEYTLEPASNAIGDGSEFQWLTSNAGTGAWALYVLRTRIGATGSFSSTGFLHVATGPNVAFTWDIAKFDQIDITSSTRAFLGRGGVSRENGSPVFDADAITSMGVSAGFVGAGPGATAAAADVMNSYVANTLTPIGSYAVVRGNTVSKIGGTHGAFEGGAVGTPVRGGAYVSSSIIGAVEGGSWVTTLALDDDATSFSHGTQLAKIQYNAIAGSGTLSLFVNGGFMGSSSISGVTALSRLRLIYDGTSFKGEVDGISYLSTPAPIGLKLWPKVLDLYLSTNLGGRSPTSDIQYGPWSDSSIGSISLFDRHGGIYYINGGSIHKLPTIAAAWDYSVYTKNSQRGSAYLSGQMVLAGTFIGLTDTITDSNYGSFSYAWHRSENGNWYAFESGSDVYFGTTLNGVIFGPNTVFDVVYDGFNIRYLADGVVMRIVATSAGRLFYGCASAYYNSDQVQISNLAFGPATNLRTYRDDGQTPMPQAEFRTAEGIAAGFLGASAWATYNSRTPTDVSNRLSFLQADGTMRLGSANGVISEGGDYWITNANAVTSLGIAAGFVGAGPGATASATDVLNSYLPFGQNLIPNSDQTQRQNLYLRWNPDGMSLPWGPPQHVANGFVGWSESNYILPGNVKASAVYQSGRVNSPTYGYVDFDINRGDGSRFRTPCVPGERFIASGYFGGHRCDGSLVVCFEDKAGNFLSFTDAPLAVGLDNLQSSLAEMTRVSASAVAPSGAATASIIVKKFNTKPGSPDSYWWCAGIMLERAAANQPGPSPYMPGPPSDTRQLGYTGHLNADVTTQNIAAGFLGAGALATQNVVSWNSQVSGRPEPITNLDSAGFIYADYIRNGGIQLNNRWPAEFGANVTENRIAAGFVGAGALATKNNINLATSDVATIGNIPPTVPDNSFAFTTTTTSVSISWPAITIYRADGSNISVASGSQVVTGLSSGAYYKFYAYIVDSGGGNATVQFVSGGAGATGSPAICFNGGSSALAASVMYARGNVALGGILFTTPSSGGGGGGGGGSSCLHPDTSIADAPASRLRVGSLVPTPNGTKPVVRLTRRACSLWYAIDLAGGETVTVTSDHRLHLATGYEVRASDIRLGDLLAARADHAEVVGLRLSKDCAELVSIELDDPHLYYLGKTGLLCHNPKP